jgi:hypothetical protein
MLSEKGRIVTQRARRTIVIAALVLAAGAVGHRYYPFVLAHISPPDRPRPEKRMPWATKMEVPPLENFYRVAPELYRGAQPDAGKSKSPRRPWSPDKLPKPLRSWYLTLPRPGV